MKLFSSKSVSGTSPRYAISFPRRRRLQWSISAFSGMTLTAFSSFAFSLGLGEMQSNSYLGQLFSAEIELVSIDDSVDLNTILVRQVPVDEARKMGVDIAYTPYQFNLVVDKSSGIPKLAVASGEVIKEPYLNLLIELRWPAGVVYREYPVLLDPQPAITVNALPSKPEREQPRVARPRPPASNKQATNSNVEPVKIALPPLRTEDGKYQVQSGDSLSKIAQRWREGTSQGISETMRWIHENNPEAFTRGNINQLRAGAVLQMPDLSAFEVVANDGAAEPESERVIKDASNNPNNQSDSVIPLSTDTDVDSSSPAKVGQDAALVEKPGGLLTVSATTKDDRTRELIDLLVRENETLKERVERLENSEYLDTLKRLIVLQRQQISDLRSDLGVADSAVTAEMDALLAQIGVATAAREPGTPTDLAANPADISTQEEQSKAPLQVAENSGLQADNEQVREKALLNIQPTAEPVLPEAVEEKRGWFLWLVIGAAIVLAALFAGMYAYYRKLVPVKNVEDEYEEIIEPLDEGDGIGRTRYDSSSLDEPTDFVLYDNPPHVDVQPVIVQPQEPAVAIRRDKDWLGERADSLQEDDPVMKSMVDEMQNSFESIALDESALINLDNIIESSAAPEVASEKDTNKPKASPKMERRPDDEVRLSIAEKMSQYNPEEYRNELESLGFLELDELVDINDSDEDEVEAIIYRAKMFCEFKKFDKAVELILNKKEVSNDPRLSETLDEVYALRDASISNKKVS